MGWRWFKSTTVEEPPRRAATREEMAKLRELSARKRPMVLLLTFILLTIACVVVAATLRPRTALGTGIQMGAIVGACGCALLATLVIVQSVVRGIRIAKIRAVADPLLSPIVPLAESDRVGAWLVVQADPDVLHVSRTESVAGFHAKRGLAALWGVLLCVAAVGTIVGVVVSGTYKAVIIKAVLSMFAPALFLFRHAFTRVAYQWKVERERDAWTLETQDERLLAKSDTATITSEMIKGFTATPALLAIELADGSKRPLAELGRDPLAGWRAACIATSIAGLMDVETTLTYENEFKITSAIAIPATLADDADFSPSTSPA